MVWACVARVPLGTLVRGDSWWRTAKPLAARTLNRGCGAGVDRMNILVELQQRFAAALAGMVDDPAPLVALVRPSQDAKFGDYQANFAMPLGKQLGKQPRDVAAEVVARLSVQDLCERRRSPGRASSTCASRRTGWPRRRGERLPTRGWASALAENPRTYVIDYSAPNVAKPMHVGHIRSTVIGDSLNRTLRFLGHRVIGDNHIGDWGTQFGMIIYGYKHFARRGGVRGPSGRRS